MEDKVCLVTGASSGIGRATAAALAGYGATVLIICRDANRGLDTQADLQAATGNDRIILLLADLSTGAPIRTLVNEIRSHYKKLDVLVNNAGVVLGERHLTAEGHEQTFAVNHLAYFRLTLMLIDLVCAAPAGRVINVSSEAHRGAHIDFDDLHFARRRYRMMAAYGQSKLANILFTYSLAARLAGTRATANALHPGMIGTNIGRGTPVGWFFKLGRWFRFLPSPKRGAATSLYLATSSAVAGVTGQYFIGRKAARSSPASYDAAAGERLWQMSLEMTGLERADPF